jgi:DegV family protein with EDD domain
MHYISILTDSAVQFTSPVYEGHELVSIIPMHIQVGDEWLRDTRDPRVCGRLASLSNGVMPHLHPPSVDEFVQAFVELSHTNHNILAILTSDHLCEVVKNAQKAAEIVKGPAKLFIIDSQTTGPGLGALVQKAAQMALRVRDGAQLSRFIRGQVPHIYTAFCLQSLYSLAVSGHLDPAQAKIGEMLNLIPFYILDSGRLVPVQKARSSRQIVDLLHEFASEFEHLEHIALLQGLPPYEQETRNLRDRLSQTFPLVPVSEHMLSASLLALFGPRSLGLVAIEEGEL